MKSFEIISEPKELYRKMLRDISRAKKSVCLETYIYSDDKIGKLFCF
jgi:phosphatidylserine/phosphatidylglycerophosphate/cardiolipin synthase-like enzyme